jgi:HIRAN domain
MGATRRTFLAFAGAGPALLGAGAAPAFTTAPSVPLLSTYVAGSDRYSAPSVAGNLAPGALVRLTREPENDYDPRAVAVFLPTGEKLGYVPRIHNQPLANLLDAAFAVEARVARVSGRPERPDIGLAVTLLATGAVAPGRT